MELTTIEEWSMIPEAAQQLDILYFSKRKALTAFSKSAPDIYRRRVYYLEMMARDNFSFRETLFRWN